MPLSEKQRESFRESNARINIWEGSVRSGKTYVSLLRFITEIESGPEGDYVIICRTYDMFKKNLLKLIEGFCKFNSHYYIGKREIHIYGKTVHIVGADDERAEAKIRGATFKGAYVDEATIIPKTVWLQLIARCMMGDAKIFATTNPDSPFHWLKKDFLDGNPSVKSWQFSPLDNPELKQHDKDYLKTQYKGLWYQRFVEGKWVQAEGAIYDMFDTSLHVIDYPPGLAEYNIVGVDYGTSNPCSFVLLGVNRNKFPNVWVEDEYYYDSKVHQRQKTDSEYADDLKNFIKDKPIKAIYIDPSAASFRLELQKQGVTNIYDAENEVNDGIRFVSMYLNNGTMKVCANCKNLIKEIQSYVWDPKAQTKGEDKPMKQFDHAIDALRYVCYTHFHNKANSTMSAIELDRSWMEVIGGGQHLPSVFQNPNRYY